MSMRPADGDSRALWHLLEAVKDPEVPVLSIRELGVLRDVCVDSGHVRVVVAPTYSGCPAMGQIEKDIRLLLAGAGYAEVNVRRELTPAWTTDAITADGRSKLRRFGVAPPPPPGRPTRVRCPRCGDGNVHVVSEFGSTACKALYSCGRCLEPFEHFKCLR